MFQTPAAAGKAILELIEGCYHPQRVLQNLGYGSAEGLEQLTGKLERGAVQLAARIRPGKDDVQAEGCRVYQAWYPLDSPPCTGCPIEMKGIDEDIQTVISGAEFSCSIPGPKEEGIWFFQVRLLGTNGALGPYSERIQLSVHK